MLQETHDKLRPHLAKRDHGCSFALALLRKPTLSGMIYMIIGPMQTVLGMRHGKRRRALMTEPNSSQLSVIGER